MKRYIGRKRNKKLKKFKQFERNQKRENKNENDVDLTFFWNFNN